MNYQKIYTLLMLSLGLLLACANATSQTDNKRYVGLIQLNLDPNPDAGMEVIEEALRNGANFVIITIQWDEVYKTATSAPDWRKFDRQIEYIAKANAKIGLRIVVGRLNYRLDGFWTDQETMKDDLNRPMVGVYQRTCFSFSHQPTVAKSLNFIKEVCQRYNHYQNNGTILFASVGNLSTQELGFPHDTQFDADKYLASFDYSAPSILAFRAWAESKYKFINKLNYQWKTKFTSFNELLPPPTSYTPFPAFRKRAGKDWYLFLHSQLKNYADQAANAIKQVNPNYKVINQFGTVTSDISILMTKVAFKDLNKQADGVEVHNDPYDNHRWITDVLRSNSDNKWLINEVFYTPQTPKDILIRQFDECFEHGCKVVSLVLSGPDTKSMEILRNVANRWIDRPLTPITPRLSMSYTVTEVLDSAFTKIEKTWRNRVGNNPQPVNVQLVEDILSDEYWKPLTTNVPPIVNTPLTERASKPRKMYTYALPKDVFIDPDGEIVKIEVLEKPSWLNFNNGTFSGTVPDLLGDNKITLRATDNEGASVQASFNLKVVNLNVKPVVIRTIPNFETYYEQHIFYQFPGMIFDDPDGVIVRTEARGLRPWMTYTGKEFSAFPQEKGTFPITLRALDDDSATVETTFNVKVLNRLPVVRQLLPEKVIAQNKAFRFRISPAIFADPDGQIARLEALGLPAWLSFNGFELTGTPTQLTTYRIRIRAYDDSGDWVETPFTIVVDTRANLNQPPVARFRIPDAQLFVTQRFSYKIPDSLFFDTNGYVDRLEFPNLPSWLTVKGNEMTGLATQPGTFTVTIRAIDDDETGTSTSFTIVVRPAQLSFQVIKAGKIGTRQILGALNNNDTWTEASLPERITIYAFCDAPIKQVRFELSGPFQKSLTATRFPYTLFDEEEGFAPIAGDYTLFATAFNDSIQVSTARIQFKVQPSQPLQEWSAYPNPTTDVLSLMLPATFVNQKLTFQIVSTFGKILNVHPTHINVASNVVYLATAPYTMGSGTYFIKIIPEDSSPIIIKFVKQ
ncbi:MAG: putative Ig domain-containing protein [Spirosomaceae bacterium]|nr:putative Ig domain-containing protein [Spirosomataceae bacterium]